VKDAGPHAKAGKIESVHLKISEITKYAKA